MSSDQKIPICYFPSTVIFVGIHKDYTESIASRLESHALVKCYALPRNALAAIHTNYQSQSGHNSEIPEHHYQHHDNALPANFTLNLNLAAIHCEVYNPTRFNEISVIVVDQTMDNMTGIEFCKKMDNSPIKRILLLNRTHEQEANKAKKDGIIDDYIIKQDFKAVDNLFALISKLKNQYFQSMSELILKMLTVSSPACLLDPVFVEYFNKVIKDNHVVEYYLTDSSGSFLLFDAAGNFSYLLVRTQQDINKYYEHARSHHASEQLLSDLNNGTKIPFFWWQDSLPDVDEGDWSTYLYPAEKITNNNTTYFCAYINNPTLADLHTKRILSFQAYEANMSGSTSADALTAV